MPLNFNSIENLIGLQDIRAVFVNEDNGIVEVHGESKPESEKQLLEQVCSGYPLLCTCYELKEE
ncbi:hypothetical protein [Clostridium sp.]|uniref:hypothetical protein n=1 Tax=Clostridium sp. TaxID=1506 RepID=UPI0035A0DDC6